jgi:quercetin dioxygenase-like cupin family protein
MENLAQAKLVANMIEYQAGSIVSKTIFDKSSGSITLFAFDKGQKLSEHTAPFDAFVYIIDGNATISISGQPISIKQGETIIMPADKPHAVATIENFKMLLVMMKSQ